MAKKLAPVEVNSFVGGLISDANPLTFPPNASLDEVNIELNSDGSRNRRLGMDFEVDAVEITTSVSVGNSPAHTTFKWENAGGDPEKNLLVVQFGNEIKFFNFDNVRLSSSVLYTKTFNVSTFSTQYSYASVDGTLIVVTGAKEVNIFTYDGSTISHSTDYLRVRDLFGVEDVIGGVDLRAGNNVTNRPNYQTDAHIYNLRNQSWGKSVVCSTPTSVDDLALKDPITTFSSYSSVLPSNSDAVHQALYPNANLASNRTIERFAVEDLYKNPLGSSHVATGHFIIDALERGTSRLSVYAGMMAKYPQLNINITSLPLDKTPGGASVVAQYAGRIWYAGFIGTVSGGDKKSPKFSSYVLFSQLVEDPTDIVKCYQEGDPTSKEEPDLLDTDGGFIRIDEAYGIKALVAAGNSLFVLASNGVWRITGGAKDEGFTATNYSVSKVTNIGCRGRSSVISAEGSAFFWGDDGIYIITSNEFGDWISKSVVQNKIQNFYNDISSSSKEAVQGFYDGYEHKVRWVYDNILGVSGDTKELIYDVQLDAFSFNTINTVDGDLPKLAGIYESPAFRLIPGVEDVSVGLSQVVVGVNNVVSGTQTRQSSTREIGYIVVTSMTGSIKYKFATYKDTNFLDWKSFDGTGVDAAGYILTGYFAGGDYQRQKVVPLLTVYMNKTETGFEVDAGGDFVPVNASSCKVQVQWEWANSINSSRWGSEFQAYRHRKPYFPEDVNDSFDDGYEVVVTKNKVRGKGRVLSILYRTEPGKDFHLLGWSMMMGILTDV